MPFPLYVVAPLVLGSSKLPLYIGTYTTHGSRGIYRTTLDTRTGRLSTPVLAGEADNPSYLALHPDGRYLYCVHEGDRASVSGFSIGAQGKLKLVGTQPTQGGSDCYLSLDPRGRHLLVASYTGGFVTCFPVGAHGQLGSATSFVHNSGTGPNKDRQDQSHMHWMHPGPHGHYFYSCDLGTDRVQVYSLAKGSGKLSELPARGSTVAPGDGPRHGAFSHDGRYLFVTSEMGNMVTSFRLRHDGSLRRLDTYKNLPHSEVTPRVTSAEIQCHPSGKWLYVSNRGDDSISIFRVDPGGNLRWRETKKLSVHEPRGFQIDPSGRWLVVAGQNSDDLEVYRISGRSGKLYSRSRLTGISKPVCIQFVHR